MYNDRRLSPKTQLGLAALGAAALLGLIADLLLRPAPNGINVTICVTLFVGAILLLSRRWLLGITGGGRWLLPAVLAFAWRDSPVLRALNGLALLAALALAVVRLRSGQVRVSGLVEYTVVGFQASIGTALGPLFLMLDDVQWRELPRDGRWYGPARAIGRGLLIVAPLLFIFGGLFVAADAVFAGIVGEVFAIDAVELFGHLALIGFLGWIVAGLLRVALFNSAWNVRVGPPPGGLALGAIESASSWGC